MLTSFTTITDIKTCTSGSGFKSNMKTRELAVVNDNTWPRRSQNIPQEVYFCRYRVASNLSASKACALSIQSKVYPPLGKWPGHDQLEYRQLPHDFLYSVWKNMYAAPDNTLKKTLNRSIQNGNRKCEHYLKKKQKHWNYILGAVSIDETN